MRACILGTCAQGINNKSNMNYKYFKFVFDFQLNITDIKPISIHGTLDDPLIQKDFTLHIIIPVICVVILIIAVLTALLLRRRRNSYSRTPKLDSPVAFIHKQVCDIYDYYRYVYDYCVVVFVTLTVIQKQYC